MPNLFEGWYFKQQAGKSMLALIPALHTDGDGNKTASIQVITKDRSWYVPFSGCDFEAARKPLCVRAGGSSFSLRGLDLNLQGSDISAVGSLSFRNVSVPRGDIMGPFRFVPFMECRHTVFSMTHTVEGRVTVGGTVLDFSDGLGYIEGDRGRSFPKRYVWAQCSWTDGGPCALMISAADVKPLGRSFVGVIGFVRLRSREIRIATYRGARLVTVGAGALIVRQGAYTLTARLLEDSRTTLRAPADGEMVRLIKESLSCRARFTLTEGDDVLFDFETDQASFEYEF